MHANGTFEIQFVPQKDSEAEFGRMIMHKQFHGGLEGTSNGQMLSVRTAVEGSAGYVAMERFTGMLDGRSGSFVLQHSGTMARGTAHLNLSILPDSGTGALTGLSGTMKIEQASGRHTYSFDYEIPSQTGEKP